MNFNIEIRNVRPIGYFAGTCKVKKIFILIELNEKLWFFLAFSTQRCKAFRLIHSLKVEFSFFIAQPLGFNCQVNATVSIENYSAKGTQARF